MTPAQLVVRLYPAAVRERWGDELEQQVAEAGPRSWPDTIRAAVGLWLRPGLWPHTTDRRSRRTLATLAFAVIVLTTLLLRATSRPALTVSLHAPTRAAWLGLVLLGLIGATPTPRARAAALSHLVVVSTRTLGPPALALVAMLVAANSGLTSHLPGWLDPLLVTFYWATLSFGGRRACLLITRTADDTNPPSVRRLRIALGLIGSGLAVAACQLVAAMARTQTDVTGLLTAATLTVFVVVTAAGARDLHTVAW